MMELTKGVGQRGRSYNGANKRPGAKRKEL